MSFEARNRGRVPVRCQLLFRLCPQRFQLVGREFFKRARRGPFHFAEALAEAQIAVAQRHLRVHAQMAAQVDHGKQQVAELRFDCRLARRIAGCGFGLQLRRLFREFGHQLAPARPVEAGFLRLGAELGGLSQRGQRAQHAVEPRGRLLFAPKARPAACNAFSAALISSQLRRTAAAEPSTSASTSALFPAAREASSPKTCGWRRTSLRFRCVEHIGDGEVALVGGHLGIEEHLQQQIAELLGQVREVAALDGVEDLVGLFQRVFADGVEGLLAVPGAAAGSAQPGHDGHRLLKQRCRPRRIGGGLRRGILCAGALWRKIHALPVYLAGSDSGDSRVLPPPEPYTQSLQ